MNRRDGMDYSQTLAYLGKLGKYGINLGLGRITRLLELLDHPERSFRAAHITGTNGKGSVTAMLESVFRQAGLKTGMYTSPHLLEYTERIAIDGRPISRETFAAAVSIVAGAVEKMLAEGGEQPTEFEVLTAAAFWCFASAGVEYAAVEVGMGGLLDSTNVLIPDVAVITNVALDHTDRCGATVEEIAVHKAGIIKPRIPVVTAAHGGSLAVVKDAAAKQGAALYVAGEHFGAEFASICCDSNGTPVGQTFKFWRAAAGETLLFRLGLLGPHQLENAGCAAMACFVLAEREPRLTLEAIERGLAAAAWPGRCEIFPGCPPIIVDGAHNPAGAKVLRRALDELFPERQRVFVLGILKDKDIAGILGGLVKAGDRVIAVRPDSDRAAAPEVVAGLVPAGASATVALSVEDGMASAVRLAGSGGIVCAAGSLYMVGKARQAAKELTGAALRNGEESGT